MDKEVLTVEFLPSYNQYRLWNSEYEMWFKEFSKLVETCKDNQEDFRYVTYGSINLTAAFKAHGVVLEYVGESKCTK